jgi:hypothetical protein
MGYRCKLCKDQAATCRNRPSWWRCPWLSRKSSGDSNAN